MTRETKVGLLIGMGVILLIGIIVSDTLSVARQGPADLAEHGDRSQDSIFRPGPDDALTQRDMADELSGRSARETRREPLPDSDDARSRPQRQLPAALALDGNRSGDQDQRSPRSANERDDVPSLNLSHDWMFHGPDDEPTDEAVAEELDEPATPDRTTTRRLPDPPSEDRPEDDSRSADAGQTTHTVRRGETLTAIAREHYGNDDLWRLLAEVNRDVVGPDGRITVGTELTIPDRSARELFDAGFEPAGSERVVRIDQAASRATSRPGEITVASGDTLSGLAAEHLGSSNRWRDLLEANRDQLDSDTALRAGMTLKLPDGSTARRSRADNERAATGRRSYTVRSGDSLTRIAERELGDGDRWRDIFEANRDQLASPDSLRVGQTLRLP